MKTQVLQLWFVVPIFAWVRHIIYADIVLPPDPTVAGPTVVEPAVSALSSGPVIVLGLVVLVIVSISFVVVRTIKKQHTTLEDV